MTWVIDLLLITLLAFVLICLTAKIHTFSIAIILGGISNMPATLIVGQSIPATVSPLEADGSTITPGAVVSAESWSVSDSTLATVAPQADGSVIIVAIAAGSVTVSVTCTVTDADGTAGSFSASNSLTINPVPPPPARTASVEIVFGAAS